MESQEAVLRHSILDYLVRHPGAKDTREGVINWWIAKPCPDERLAIEVLEALVTSGWILKRTTASQPIYSVNHAHLNEIREFVIRNSQAK
jgi:hypothetical protein